MLAQLAAVTINLEAIRNIDLLSVGIAISAIAILGFLVFFNDRKSITNQAFLYFAIAAIFWSIYNYLFNQFPSPETALKLLRFHLFFAVWYCFFLFQFFYVFPNKETSFPKWYKWILTPAVIVVAILTLTPLVFSEITAFSPEGKPLKVENGIGIFAFGVAAVFLIFGGILQFSRKLRRAEPAQKRQFISVLIGLSITFLLHLTFNFLLPAFFNNPNFVQLGAVFTFPFVALTSYAIMRHRLFDVKIVATEILVFILSVAMLLDLILAEGVTALLLRSGVFLLVLGLSILLIRSVRKEVQQRERLQKLTEELQAANEKLKELDKLKSEFLNFASHQVKSPMAVIKGFADLIATGAYGDLPEEAKEKARTIKANADRTLALVGNLLDLGKIESGKMDFVFAQVDIAKVVHSMADDYKILGEKKGLTVSYEGPATPLMIKADEQKIRQVIQNVIDNSIKYTKAGFVKVGLKDEGQKVLVTVTDSGLGMSAELQKKLFGRFVRDDKTKNEIQGTGLGLYIAKQIVTAHNGEIWAESGGEGKGSTFNIRLSKE